MGDADPGPDAAAQPDVERAVPESGLTPRSCCAKWCLPPACLARTTIRRFRFSVSERTWGSSLPPTFAICPVSPLRAHRRRPMRRNDGVSDKRRERLRQSTVGCPIRDRKTRGKPAENPERDDTGRYGSLQNIALTWCYAETPWLTNRPHRPYKADVGGSSPSAPTDRLGCRSLGMLSAASGVGCRRTRASDLRRRRRQERPVGVEP
jgi:hypothetical protein